MLPIILAMALCFVLWLGPCLPFILAPVPDRPTGLSDGPQPQPTAPEPAGATEGLPPEQTAIPAPAAPKEDPMRRLDLRKRYQWINYVTLPFFLIGTFVAWVP